MLKKPWTGIIISILLAIAFSAAHTNIMWPSLHIANRLPSIPVILAGVVVGILFVKYFTKAGWLKTIIVAFLMNLSSSVIGYFTIIYYDIPIDLIFCNYFEYASPIHWALLYTTIAFINTLIEGGIVRLTLKLKLKNIFWWLFLANVITSILCAIYVHIEYTELI